MKILAGLGRFFFLFFFLTFLAINCSKVILWRVLIRLCSNFFFFFFFFCYLLIINCNKVFLSCDYVSLQKTIHCCLPIINYYEVTLSLIMWYHFYAANHALSSSDHKLRRGYHWSCGNISLQQAIRCCLLIINCSDVIFCLVVIRLCIMS